MIELLVGFVAGVVCGVILAQVILSWEELE